MIYDSLSRFDFYFNEQANDKIYKALKFACDFDLHADEGRYEIDGDDIYAIVAEYQSKPISELRFEAHKKYIDIQIVLAGEELLGVADVNSLSVEEAYSTEKDVAFYCQPKIYTSVLLKPGLFAVLYPHDAHQPGMMTNESCNVRKLVIKIKS